MNPLQIILENPKDKWVRWLYDPDFTDAQRKICLSMIRRYENREPVPDYLRWNASRALFFRDCLHWHGRELTGKYRHWCREWDELPIDETCTEFKFCTCFQEDE